jgi:two-component system, cell cycle sensor histidine kinase and response regulator CckA
MIQTMPRSWHPLLEAGGIACATTRVETQNDFVAALGRGGIDLILSDYSLPSFDGLSAFEIAHTEKPDLPLIFVSGTLGEESAIESLKSGATDYVLKENLARLVPAVRRAMQEVDERAEHRRLETLSIEAQKMEIMGQLASGVAHDFNNILAVITGYNDMVTSVLAGDAVALGYTEEIRLASERGAGLTRQLLVFSRKQIVQPVVLDLNEIIRGMEKLLHRLVNEPISMVFALEKELGRIKADSGYLGQLFMNLVINARDAMPEGGTLTIKTSTVTASAGDRWDFRGSAPGRYVVLSINDTGIGMTDEVKARLFEPFFTTKADGHGTGLGLAICRTIAKQSEAHIEVQSEPGKGTTFQIFCPEVDEGLVAEISGLDSGLATRGTETLLVVEDEKALRRVTALALEKLGYKILQAANGQEGLRIVNEYNESPIALVITDMIMPLMGGKVMAEWLKISHPHLKVLFSSGYIGLAATQQSTLDPGGFFIAKPYTLAALVGKVREMLDS